MILEMKVPSPGESITEVEIAEWLVQDGDYVEKDQAIAEVDSDKATLELPAEESGIITLKAEEGDAVHAFRHVEGDAQLRDVEILEPLARDLGQERLLVGRRVASGAVFLERVAPGEIGGRAAAQVRTDAVIGDVAGGEDDALLRQAIDRPVVGEGAELVEEAAGLHLEIRDTRHAREQRRRQVRALSADERGRGGRRGPGEPPGASAVGPTRRSACGRPR